MRPNSSTVLSALFVNYRSWPELAAALDSLEEHRPTGRWEVVVVDNATPERAADASFVERVHAHVDRSGGRWIENRENHGFARAMNQAIAAARGDVLLIANPDVLFRPGCVTALLQHLHTHPGVGAAVPVTFADEEHRLLLPVGLLPGLGDRIAGTLAVLLPALRKGFQRRRRRAYLRAWEALDDVSLAMFPGWCVLLPRAVLERVGHFDERFPLYYEDADLSLRVRRAGYAIAQVAGAELVHRYDRSARQVPELAARWQRVSRRAFHAKWSGPAGRALDALCTRIEDLPAVRRRVARLAQRARVPMRPLVGPPRDPIVELPRVSARFLVELCRDPFFLLSAGSFGSGCNWRPGPVLAGESEELFLRVTDLADARHPVLGSFRLPGNTS